MAKRNIIVMGGSTGAFDAYKVIVAGLPADLDAALFIVWHMAPEIRGVLPQVLSRVGPLPATQAVDGETIECGHIYIARADHHLLIEDDHIRVTRGPKENRFRPAVDPLFRSAAYSYGPRVIGVVLSGGLDDGTSGLWTIKQRGGLSVVQDPADAEISSMPENAIRGLAPDHMVPASGIADLLTRLSQEDVSPAQEVVMGDAENERTELEIRIAKEDNVLDAGVLQWGELTHFTCPECNGVLSRLKDGTRPRFRCHTGHAFSADALLSALTENIEESLWGGIRGVDESIMLLNQLGDHFAEVNQGSLAAKFFQKAQNAQKRNELIREAVFRHETLTTEAIEASDEIDLNWDRGAASASPVSAADSIR